MVSTAPPRPWTHSKRATHRASPVGSLALFYQIDRSQRLTGHVSVRGQAFSSQPSISVMGGYQAAF